MYTEDYYQRHKYWSFEGSKITNRRKCRCGNGEVVTYTRTYSPERPFKEEVQFSEDITECDICNEVNKRYKLFCKELDRKYSEEKKDIYNQLNSNLSRLTLYVLENELNKFQIKNKKHLYELLTKVRCNSFGAIGTFYRDTSGDSITGVLKKVLNSRSDNFQLIEGLYKFTQTVVAEDVRVLLDAISSLNEKLNVIENEIIEQRKTYFHELRKELEISY